MYLQAQLFRDLFLLWDLVLSSSHCDALQENENNVSVPNRFPTITTKSGVVKGRYETVDGLEVATFLGIPYAEAPIGEKRFRKPDPVKPWQGVVEATTFRPPCMQYNPVAVPWSSKAEPSEDCLFLNIWVPLKYLDMYPNQKKLAVMVWIHGGGFYTGSSDIDVYNGAVMATQENVIVASMSYRVAAFGFLDAGTPDAPGNVGLRDQTLALKWLKDNIESFSGDPDNITIFGESAGSMSVAFQVISPLSRGLFKRAIMQSCGIYHEEFGLNQTVARLRSTLFAIAVGCGNETKNLTTDPDELVACLKSKDSMELAKLETEFRKQNKRIVYLTPTVGNDFLPKSPGEILETGDFEEIPLLMGSTKDEGSVFAVLLYPEFFREKSVANLTYQRAKAMIEEMFEDSGISVDDITDFYLSRIQEEDQESLAKAVYDSIGDYLIMCPSVFTAEKMKGNVYYYYFTHIPSHSYLGPWAGSAHFDDVQFVFGSPMRYPQSYIPEEVTFSKDLMRKWASFAKTGSPIELSSDEEWPKYTKTNPMYRELNPTSKDIGTGVRTEACNFWRKHSTVHPPSTKEDH